MPENRSAPFGTRLDLGWCILNPLSERDNCRLARVKTYPVIEATMAAHAGLSRAQFKKLTTDQREDLRFGYLWMMRPFERPLIGRPLP